MKTKSILDYISFGTSLRYLYEMREGRNVHPNILDSIDRFFLKLREFELPVSERAANKLREFRDLLENKNDDYKISKDEASYLSSITDDVRKTLFAEAEGNFAYIVTDKRIQVDKLLNDVRVLMPPDVFDSLPSIAQYDFEEAGKCIAFERPTAAAFHILRGTEAVLKNLYLNVIKKGCLAKPMWGNMVEALKNRKRNRPPKPLLDDLEKIKDNYRNPTQHPEKIYDIEEAQDLFNSCIGVINQMASFIK